MLNLPEWVFALVGKLKNIPETDYLEQIRTAFRMRGLKPSTTVNYISQLQTLLLNEGLLVKEIHETDFDPQSAEEQKEVKKILTMNPLKRYRFWQKLNRHRDSKNVVWKKFKNFELRGDFLQLHKFNADLIEPGIVMEVKETQTYVQENPTKIIIEQGNSFVKEVLRGFEIGTLGSLFCALLLSSGRRPSTYFLHPDAFQPNPDENFSCIFTERLKVRDSEKKKTIPLLVPFEYFREKLFDFHSMLPFDVISPVDVNKTYEREILRWVDTYVSIPIKPYHLRAIYARIMCDITRDNSLHPLFYIGKILLHGSINSSISYDKVLIHWQEKPELPFDFHH